MSGRAWSTFGFGVGVVASISANVAHSYVGSKPAPGAIVAAGFWPVGLLIALEVISRVSWPRGWQWWLTRYAGLTTVALIAAVVSYRHMSGLLASYGEDGFSAAIGPLAIDGLMVVCSVALLAIADNQRRIPSADVITIPIADAYQPTEISGNATEISVPAAEPKPATIARFADAHKAYAASVEAGTPMTGKQLGELFGRSDRWGRARIGEARTE